MKTAKTANLRQRHLNELRNIDRDPGGFEKCHRSGLPAFWLPICGPVYRAQWRSGRHAMSAPPFSWVLLFGETKEK